MVEKRNSNTKGVYLYYHQFYRLKLHDRDRSPDGVYKSPRGFCGSIPSEAVDRFRLSAHDLNICFYFPSRSGTGYIKAESRLPGFLPTLLR